MTIARYSITISLAVLGMLVILIAITTQVAFAQDSGEDTGVPPRQFPGPPSDLELSLVNSKISLSFTEALEADSYDLELRRSVDRYDTYVLHDTDIASDNPFGSRNTFDLGARDQGYHYRVRARSCRDDYCSGWAWSDILHHTYLLGITIAGIDQTVEQGFGEQFTVTVTRLNAFANVTITLSGESFSTVPYRWNTNCTETTLSYVRSGSTVITVTPTFYACLAGSGQIVATARQSTVTGRPEGRAEVDVTVTQFVPPSVPSVTLSLVQNSANTAEYLKMTLSPRPDDWDNVSYQAESSPRATGGFSRVNLTSSGSSLPSDTRDARFFDLPSRNRYYHARASECRDVDLTNFDACSAVGSYSPTLLVPDMVPAPTFPSSPVVKTDEGELTFSWQARTGVHSYQVERQIGASGTWGVVSSYATSTSYVDPNLVCNMEYNYRVKGRGDGDPYSVLLGELSDDRGLTLTCPTAPAPSNLRVFDSTTTTITLDWDPVRHPDTNAVLGISEIQYRLRYQVAGVTEEVETRLTRSHVAGLQPNTSYTFRLSAEGDGEPYATGYGTEVVKTFTTAADPPSLSISSFPASLVPNEVGSFDINATNLDSNETYQIRVRSQNSSAAGFNLDCSSNSKTYPAFSFRTSRTQPANVYGCDPGSSLITAELLVGTNTVASATETAQVAFDCTISGNPTVAPASDDVSIDIAVQGTSSSTCRFRLSLVSWDRSNFQAVIDQDFLNSPGTLTLQPVDAGEYRGRAEVCTASGILRCGPAVFSSAGVTKLATPSDLDVLPHPTNLRRFVLSWSAVPAADEYRVETLEPSTSATWTDSGESPSATNVDFDINSFLVDHTSYSLRVQALANAPLTLSSNSSDAVRIADSTISGVDGESPDGNGTVELEWDVLPGVFGGRYALRYLQVPYRGTWVSNDSWRPNVGGTREMAVDQIPLFEETVDGLTEGQELYAFQLVYGPAFTNNGGDLEVKPTVFSVRDDFAWPSATGPEFPERIATFPSFGHWPNGLVEYSICEGTFTELGADANWPSLIEYAFERWEVDVRDMLTMTRVTDGCVEQESGSPLSNSNRTELYKAFYNDTNEVYMYQSSDGEFFQMLLHNPLFLCIRVSGACVISPRYVDIINSGSEALGEDKVDVVVNPSLSGSGDLVPGGDFTHNSNDVRLETCLDSSGRPFNLEADDKDGDYEKLFRYTLMVHEAGHLVGLSNFNPVNPLDFTRTVAHPSMHHTVMNYDELVGAREPDCGLHPLDKLAVRALYQTVTP